MSVASARPNRPLQERRWRQCCRFHCDSWSFSAGCSGSLGVVLAGRFHVLGEIVTALYGRGLPARVGGAKPAEGAVYRYALAFGAAQHAVKLAKPLFGFGIERPDLRARNMLL